MYRPPPTKASPLTCISVHSNGRRAACGTQDGRIFLITTSTGKLQLSLEAHEALVASVKFVGKGSKLVSCSWDSSTRLWSLGKKPIETALMNHDAQTKVLAVTSTSTKGAVGARDGVIKVFSKENLKCLRNIDAHRTDISGLAFTSDSSKLISTSWDGESKLWNASTCELVRTIKKQKERIRSVAITPDDSRVFLGLHSGDIVSVSLEGKSKPITFKGHTDIVSSLSVDPSGRYLVSGGWDRSIRIWSLETMSLLCRENLWTALTSHEWGPRGERIYSAHASGALAVWDLKWS
ncbi:MAG: WD40 repeat domain-containing protein [Candidatus Thorarchaeota archaeon]